MQYAICVRLESLLTKLYSYPLSIGDVLDCRQCAVLRLPYDCHTFVEER